MLVVPVVMGTVMMLVRVVRMVRVVEKEAAEAK